MATIQELMLRAQLLREETAVDSISPERAGGIMYDTLAYINQMQLQDANPLLISKIYASVAAMEADSAPVSDLTGQPLRPGQVVCIVTEDDTDPDYGMIYRYDGTTGGTSSWTAVGRLGSDPYLEGYQYMDMATPETNPGTPDQKVFYIATKAGTYTYFGGIEVYSGEIALLYGSGSSWSISRIFIPRGVEADFSRNGYVNTDGDYTDPSNLGYNCTELIPVNEGDTIVYFGRCGSAGIAVSGFDQSGSFVSSLIPAGFYINKRVIVPAGVSNIIACGRNNTLGDIDPVMYIIPCQDTYEAVILKTRNLDGIAAHFGIAGYIDNPSGGIRVNSAYSRTDFIPVIPGMVVEYTGSCGSGAIPIAGFNIEGQYLTNILNYGNYRNERVTIPNGVAYIIASSRNETFTPPQDYALILPLSGAMFEEMFDLYSELRGKLYSVMGDSIGTDKDEDTPLFTLMNEDVGESITSWITWFDFNNSRLDTPSGLTKTIGGVAITEAMVGTEQTFTPALADVGKTLGTPRWSYNKNNGIIPWWRILAARLGMVFDASASWNGSSYTSHEENTDLWKIAYGWHPLQIARLANRDTDGSRIDPEVIFLCRGTNDATHSPYAKITDFGDGIDQIPDDDIVNGSDYGFKEAIAKTVSAIQTTYPKAKIYISTLSPFRRLGDTTFPMDNSTYTMQAYNKAIKEVAEYMGCKVIDFAKCWTFYNCVTQAYVNSGDFTHPTQKGHNEMALQAFQDVTR